MSSLYAQANDLGEHRDRVRQQRMRKFDKSWAKKYIKWKILRMAKSKRQCDFLWLSEEAYVWLAQENFSICKDEYNSGEFIVSW